MTRKTLALTLLISAALWAGFFYGLGVIIRNPLFGLWLIMAGAAMFGLIVLALRTR